MLRLLERLRRRRETKRCAEARERIHEVLDAEMPPGRKRERIAEHLESCMACGATADEIRALKDAVARVGRDPDPQVKARLTQVVDEIRKGEVEV